MTGAAPRRATSLAELGPLLGACFRDDEIAASIASYRPRPTDIVISPYSKCGTTWLQQVFHTLRTGGDMDFEDISAVVPWIETAAALGIDLEAPQRGRPRGFKSHLAWDTVPKGARYVVALRDPRDALVSLLRFFEGWFLEPGAVAMEDFAAMYLSRPRSYFDHLLSWWGQRDNPDVLLLTYEHMIDDPRGTTLRLAAFCGIPADEPLIDLALARGDIGFMLAHKGKFADPMMRRLSETRCNLPRGGDSAKVRKGAGGRRAELPPALSNAVDRAWRERVTPATGFETYTQLEAAVRPG